MLMVVNLQRTGKICTVVTLPHSEHAFYVHVEENVHDCHDFEPWTR